jgi:dynein heavy chain
VCAVPWAAAPATLQELDPALEPVLNKSIIKRGNRETIRLGDKELDYSRDFKLYITTKLANPHFTPEVSTKVRRARWCGVVAVG